MIDSPDPTTRVQDLGPYRLIEVLAHGGGSVVYRARERATGRAAALKALARSEARGLAALRREVQLLSRLSHPGVVRIQHAGLDESPPWYAMDLVEGPTLDRYGALAGDAGPRSLEEIEEPLRAVQRLCATLSHLHGEGIVHRDLKPSNVMVSSEGWPVLVDFGLVGHSLTAAGREALEAGGEVLGTFEYISPEQALGQYVDARADLYSLGCILYEIVTGVPPFQGEPEQVMQQHIGTEPVSPSARRAQIPESLESLILRLLAKDPRRRLGYASDVAERLAEHTGEKPPDRVAARSYLYRPSFSGRTPQLAALTRSLEAARTGDGALALIAGESGVGKTRLAMELTRQASSMGLAIVTGECAAPGGRTAGDVTAAPLHPLRPLLRAIADHCRLNGAAATDRILGPRARVLAEYEASLLTVPGGERHPNPAPLPPGAARGRLFGDLRHALARFSDETALLLVLDDLQWADELTLAFLGSLGAEDFEGMPLLLVGTYRIEEAGDALTALAGQPHTRVLDLERVGGETVAAIISDMLALEPAPPALVRFLTEQSEGNPFFVSEYLRAAVESELLRRTGSGDWALSVQGRAEDAAYEDLALPGALRDLLEQRLSGLGRDARRCLEVAAVLGREFGIEENAALCGHTPEASEGAVGELVRRQVIEEAGEGRLRFDHDKLREAAYARIPVNRRRSLHRRVGEMIEARTGADRPREESYVLLAHHWLQADMAEKSLDYLGKAGERALRTGAAHEARRLLARAIETDRELGGPSESLLRARWQRMLGEACAGLGDLESSIEHCHVSVASLGSRVPAGGFGWTGVLASEALRQLRHRVVGPPGIARTFGAEGGQETARASGLAAQSLLFGFVMLPALASSLRCINSAERARSPSTAALSYSQVAYVAGSLRLHRLANWYFAHARQVGDLEADPTSIAAGIYFHAMYETGLGHWSRSVELATEAFERLYEIDNQQEAEVAATVLANSLYFQGRFEEAADYCEEIHASAEKRGDTQRSGWGLFLQGRSYLALGNLDAALDLLERGYASLRRVPDVVSLVMCEGLLAQARLQSGRRSEALDVASSLRERLNQGGLPVIPLVQCLDGYRGLAELELRLWQESDVARGPERDAARRACGDLRLFANLFPIARPEALRTRARVEWLDGRHERARRDWRRAADAAAGLEMPFDEALAHADLARAADTDADRATHFERASSLFTSLGCARGPAEAAELRVEGTSR